MGCFPARVCSNKLPYEPASDPEMVPDPKRSPGRKLHPEMVWCAIICGQDQSRFFEQVFVNVCSFPSEAGKPILAHGLNFDMEVGNLLRMATVN